tara:strand:+ start:8896 stop:10035 length:1140 start_codon:yes stop_codon:yes gene_type:complete
MKTKNTIKGLLLSSIVILGACSKNDDQPVSCTVTTPDSYIYNVDGANTVSYGGQTARLDMAAEMMSALSAETTTEAALNGMFDHQQDGVDFSDDALNASSKQIKGKTATAAENSLSSAEQAHIQAKFDGWFADYATNVAPAIGNGTMASSGVAGMVGNRELNAKGMEYDQIVAKSLIGALCLDQVVNGYLSASKIGDAVDNTTRDPNEDNNATAMEHHWDEGYGYVYGKFGPDNNDGDLSSDGLLGKYLNKYDDHKITVFNAFKMGRQAISENCAEERDRQAQIIKETLSKVVALKAAGYLRDAATSDDLSADYFHALSEGYGFILSLQFTYDTNGMAYFSHSEIESMLATLESGNGFWDRTDAELNEMATTIETAAGL